MDHHLVEALMSRIAPIICEHMDKSLMPLLARIEALEAAKEDEHAKGEKGESGERGRDGTGIAGAAITREGELMLTLSDGVVLTPGRVDGRDGLSIEDLSVEYDGERTLTLVFARGEKRKDIPIVFPWMIYRGVFDAGASYLRGDVVTLNGSMYHANVSTRARPGDGSPDWTLAVKHGRDGRVGRDAAPLAKTPVTA